MNTRKKRRVVRDDEDGDDDWNGNRRYPRCCPITLLCRSRCFVRMSEMDNHREKPIDQRTERKERKGKER